MSLHLFIYFLNRQFLPIFSCLAPLALMIKLQMSNFSPQGHFIWPAELECHTAQHTTQ